MAASGMSISIAQTASPALRALIAGTSPLGVAVAGAGALVQGIMALEQAKAYEAQVDVLCAREDSRILIVHAQQERYAELGMAVRDLEQIADNQRKAFVASVDPEKRERNRQLFLLALEALERAIRIDR